MVFLLGFSFPEYTLVTKALTSLYGIGQPTAARIMAKFSIHDTAKLSLLAQSKITALQNELNNMKIENDLRRKVVEDIKRLRDMKSYRGMRHAMSLPARGQRTRTQIKTARKLNRTERRV
ncbi:40S ribosomal protein s13 [Ascobolus immersus RN42]|uniref:40S ribosomal protein s13 n=1 Tax=Ascobolus immersus RN42 TaxID=1160509 RepID=A0A3N4IN54_ASCIM|nr:40S ribosomal protein s13 [Ascobolus immersus RN42]